MFNKGGILYFKNPDKPENPTVGPWYKYLTSDSIELEPYDNTRAFLASCYNLYFFEARKDIKEVPITDITDLSKVEGQLIESRVIEGLALFCDAAYSAFPEPQQSNDAPETFVLNHPDLDLQNIFVDKGTGHIFSIIDSQETRIVPRPIGSASLPLPLRQDWDADFTLGHQLPPCTLASYREDYIRYMAEALAPTPSPDAKFTRYSYWYWFAMNATMFERPNLWHFAARMVREIECLRTFDNPEPFLLQLGKVGRHSSAFTMLKREFEGMYKAE